ncbi:hypothetical protein [Oceanobacter sp. 3_MG-2023]|uniref:hypothetical protein n=1 Tax=Oceanobacter sp. 3_MG-2023 TaxID=3062622 RepID=UPI0027349303|nr:hypothetical protein [Oceanobacter sp. 3_MG-2023]MDP2504995.1 hypothetical protein [Oceanobacter sp. 3_MG-2023]
MAGQPSTGTAQALLRHPVTLLLHNPGVILLAGYEGSSIPICWGADLIPSALSAFALSNARNQQQWHCYWLRAIFLTLSHRFTFFFLVLSARHTLRFMPAPSHSG